jgi:hypothetical protein
MPASGLQHSSFKVLSRALHRQTKAERFSKGAIAGCKENAAVKCSNFLPVKIRRADYPIKGPRWLKNRQKYRSFFAKYGEIAGFLRCLRELLIYSPYGNKLLYKSTTYV